MKTLHPRPNKFVIIDEAFRFRSYELLGLGFAEARNKISFKDDEPNITSLIVEEMDLLLKTDGPLRKEWFDHFSVSDNPRVPKPGKKGKWKPQIDIYIRNGKLPCPEYLFEAKQLKRPGFPASKYTRKGGMEGSFVVGHYARQYSEAGMVGYVRGDTIAEWKARLLKQIEKDKSLLSLVAAPEDVFLHEAFPEAWKTQHRRKAVGKEITLYHVLMECVRRSQLLATRA